MHTLFNRGTQYGEIFDKAAKEFDVLCTTMEHMHCCYCHTVSLRYDVTKGKKVGDFFICEECTGRKKKIDESSLPVWYSKEKVAQYHVPIELSRLREGEKLLIQQVSVFVPLHHIKFGQLATQGHVVSFPQDLESLCQTLPCIPDDVNLVRVVKKFKILNRFFK